MSPLFKLGEKRLADLTTERKPWMLKERAVLAGADDARAQIESAQTNDERRLAEQKLTRFEFTGKRLKAERLHREALARILAA